MKLCGCGKAIGELDARHDPPKLLSRSGFRSSIEAPVPRVAVGHGNPTPKLTSSTGFPPASTNVTFAPSLFSVPIHGPNGTNPNAIRKAFVSAATTAKPLGGTK